MIDYAKERARLWGREMRWVYSGKAGWPPRTILDKMIKEGVLGASSSRFMQSHPEFLSEDATETNIAIKQLPERDREMIFVHYVVTGFSKTKAMVIGCSVRTYYARVDAGLQKLSGILFSAHNSPNRAAQTPPEFDSVRVS